MHETQARTMTWERLHPGLALTCSGKPVYETDVLLFSIAVGGSPPGPQAETELMSMAPGMLVLCRALACLTRDSYGVEVRAVHEARIERPPRLGDRLQIVAEVLHKEPLEPGLGNVALQVTLSDQMRRPIGSALVDMLWRVPATADEFDPELAVGVLPI
jgi:hypothetical protein